MIIHLSNKNKEEASNIEQLEHLTTPLKGYSGNMRIISLSVLVLWVLFSVPALADKKENVPFRADSGLISAEYYLATGKYAEALTVLGGVLQRHPNSADAYTYRGYAYDRLGDKSKARENYQKALLLEQDHLGANRYLAGIFLQEGDLTRALEQMQVIRMICGDTACEELDDLRSEINQFQAEKK